MSETSRTRPAVGDDVLLLHAMMLMVAADGHPDPEELASVEAFFVALPDFRGHNFRHVLDEALKLMRRFESAGASVAALAGLSSPALKARAWLLAADIAMASGIETDEREDTLLDTMQRILEVSDETARKIIDVLVIKYGG